MNKPNIIYMFADDLGLGDLSCYNPCSKLHTERLDQMASEGMRFTDAHSTSALCTPSRYGLLTGRYNWRSSLKRFVYDAGAPNLIEDGRLTVASMLKTRGYNTSCVGKWHLGMQWEPLDPNGSGAFNCDYSKPFRMGPTDVGFDYFYGLECSLNQPPYVFLENDHATKVPNSVTGEKNYYPGIPGSSREMWIYGPADSEFDLQACTAKLQEKALQEIDRLAGEQEPFFLYYPTTAVHVPWLPSKEFEGTSGIGYYGDFVLMTDHMVGEILNLLKEKGIEDNTIFIFASDNGSGAFVELENIISAGHNPSFIYRGYKGDIYEGGHRIPYIVKAPGLVPPGSVCNQSVSLCDLMATLAEYLDIQLPDEAGEDSVSNLCLWRGENKAVREDIIYSSFDGSLSIQKGPWKLALCPGCGSPSDRGSSLEGKPEFQLFRMDADVTERVNLIDKAPEIAEELKHRLVAYIRNGRSTPGKPQLNTGENPNYWNEIAWIREVG